MYQISSLFVHVFYCCSSLFSWIINYTTIINHNSRLLSTAKEHQIASLTAGILLPCFVTLEEKSHWNHLNIRTVGRGRDKLSCKQQRKSYIWVVCQVRFLLFQGFISVNPNVWKTRYFNDTIIIGQSKSWDPWYTNGFMHSRVKLKPESVGTKLQPKRWKMPSGAPISKVLELGPTAVNLPVVLF